MYKNVVVKAVWLQHSVVFKKKKNSHINIKYFSIPFSKKIRN